MDDLYGSYTAFKDWTSDEVSRPEDHAEMIRLSGKSGRLRILEVGFGSGGFLNWARDRHEICGIDIIPEIVARARAAGHEASLGTVETLQAEPFDLVVAVDVLEHLTIPELRSFFTEMGRLLKPDGRLVARFPNGASPFGRAFQHGDLTHQTVLTAASVRQLCTDAGLKFLGDHNHRPPGPLKRRAAYLLRDLIETAIGLTYFGYRFPMDGNVVVVVGR